MITVITDDFRQYFDLKEEECKKYAILERIEDLKFLEDQRTLLSADPITFFKECKLEKDKFNVENKWIVVEATETDTSINIDRAIIEAITGDILVCLKVGSGRYHTKSELLKKWLICTGLTEVPKKYWIKY